MTIFNTDAVPMAGNYLSRQLEQTLPKVYAKKYPQYWAEEGMYIPATPDLEKGARTIVEHTVKEAGEALVFSDQTDDIPIVNTSMEESSFNNAVIIAGIQWSILELQAAAKAGVALKENRLAALDRAMRAKIHQMVLFGDARRSFKGFFTDSNIDVVSSSFDADASGVTAQDHINFIGDLLMSVPAASNLTAGIDTIMLPLKYHNILAKTPMPNTTVSVLKYIMDTYGPASGGTLKRIVYVNEVQAAQLEAGDVLPSGTNKDMIVMLPFNPDAIERKYFATEYLAPQQIGLNYRLIAYCGTSEIITHYPKEIKLITLPKIV